MRRTIVATSIGGLLWFLTVFVGCDQTADQKTQSNAGPSAAKEQGASAQQPAANDSATESSTAKDAHATSVQEASGPTAPTNPTAQTTPGTHETPVNQPTEAATVAIDPMDWPNWRGPEQNRISRETGLVDHWDPYQGEMGENVLWANPDAGGISTPIVMRGKLYTISRYKPGTKQEGEQVICLDAATGKILWQSPHNVYLSDVPAERIGWSNRFGDPTTGRVYAQGVNGYFQCLDGETGKTIWSRSLHEEFGVVSTYGGRTGMPVLFEDLVIVNAVVVGWGDTAPPAQRFIAMDKNSGEVRWISGTKPYPEDTIYSTPTVTVLDGRAALVFGSSDGAIWNFQPRTGLPVWNYRMSRRGLCVSPLVVGDTIYMGQNEENLDNNTQGMLTAVRGIGKGDITKTNTIWQLRGVMEGKSSPLLVDGRIYVADDEGKLHIVDAKTGKRIGQPVRLTGTIVFSTPLYADGKIYLCSTGGWHVMRPTEKGVEIIQRLRLDPKDEIKGSPIVSHGRIYITTAKALYCVGVKDQKPAADSMPAPPKETAIGDDTKVAQVQVVPGEVLMKPGEKQAFRVRLYNDRGQFLRDAVAGSPQDGPAVAYSLDGPGQIDADGMYTAPSGTAHTATIVTAKLGNLAAKARIRVVPPLPWKFDFQDTPLVKNPKTGIDEGEAPITWIGIRHRHKIREMDGRKVMVKITTIPKGTRSQGWMGPIDMHDYTIAADLRAARGANGQLPDMGLIAQRYTLDMMGTNQQLQLRSWPPQIATAFSQTLPFEWNPDVWYRVKFRASVEGDKAVLRGKVWPRDQSEPERWTIEAVDESPNTQGSPGLFGNASNAEIYIDNVSVVPNDQPALGKQ